MNWLSPVSAFLFYGGWSAWLNVTGENPAWVLSGISHGLYAFLFTLVFRGLTRKIFLCFYQARSHYKNSQYLTFMVMSLVIFMLPVINQYLAGNVQIAMTILPGVIMGHVYLLLVLNFELPIRNFDKQHDLPKPLSNCLAKHNEDARHDT